ncbi:hypothetical protein [Cohnella hashimotonis]|uniref:Acid shock protein n=1 Tax=Cohnella hashimotonis TaxID=2826895 RepID=A0ABT6TKL3_9BACL|nr:hypothetical protein [Cohnella hashimotonis]MDI4647370.1 hypothetical protein [Cohnella hashimotonis]
MKKAVAAVLTTCMVLTAGSAAYAAAPVAEKKHEQKMHAKSLHEKKLHHKKMQEHKLKAKSKKGHIITPKATGKAKSLHSKSLRAKDVTELPKTGFGGASEQTE